MKYDSRCSGHAQFIIFLEVHYHNSIVHEIGRVVPPMTRRVAGEIDARPAQSRVAGAYGIQEQTSPVYI